VLLLALEIAQEEVLVLMESALVKMDSRELIVDLLINSKKNN